jgi:nucleotide-binding universal stress UspA family protein
MKRILVPTDFSKNAEQAVEYAALVARKFKATVTLLHAWVPDTNAMVAWTILEAESVFLKKNIQQMEKLCGQYSKKYKVKFDYVLEESVLNEFINNTIKKKKIDLVVMGTTGAGKIKNRLFGSNAARAIEKTICPLILIPAKAKPAKPSKIVFATDYYKNDLENVKQLVKFASPFNSAIEILHVAEETNAYTEKLFLEAFANRIKKASTYKKISFKIIVGSSVNKTLEDYARRNQVDLIAMSSSQHTIFERLFVSSITKKASYHTKFPLFVFHQN